MFNEDFYFPLCHPLCAKDKTGLERLGDFNFSPCFLCMQMCVWCPGRERCLHLTGFLHHEAHHYLHTRGSPTHPPTPTLLKHPSPTLLGSHDTLRGGGGGLYYQPFILHSSFALFRNCSHPSRVFNSLQFLSYHLSAFLCTGTQHCTMCTCINNSNNVHHTTEPKMHCSTIQYIRVYGIKFRSENNS